MLKGQKLRDCPFLRVKLNYSIILLSQSLFCVAKRLTRALN